MTPYPRVLLGVVAATILSAQAASAQQKVLVQCGTDGCVYQQVAAVAIGGRTSLRLVANGDKGESAAAVKNAREVKLEQVPGLYRDPASGVVFALGPDGKPREIALPEKVDTKGAISPAAIWRATTLEYRDAPNAKTGTPVMPERFAYLFITPEPQQTVLRFLQTQLDARDPDPRRIALIRGGIAFSKQSPGIQQWISGIVSRLQTALDRFEKQEGDPTQVAPALRDAMQLRSIYTDIAGDTLNKSLVDRLDAADALLKRRLTVAEALRKGEYWDEYLTKLSQLGLAKWSSPGILDGSRAALAKSAELHQQRSKAFSESGHLDRAFDESELSARASCDTAAAIDAFYQARVLLVNKNEIASAAEYSGKNKALLDQIVRELDQLDTSKDQLTLDSIRRGEALDPNFLPLQLKKAEFLDKLGRHRDALDVVRRVERNIPLDPKQLNDYLGLDGRIKINLLDAVQKTQEQAQKEFEALRFQPALDITTKGLRADPRNGRLLYYAALSAAFLRQVPLAITFVQTYLRDVNLACAPTAEPDRILELYRMLLAPPPPSNDSREIPHWMSGVRYGVDVYYDPISLGFLQAINRVDSNDGMSTVFRREDRSFLVKSILTDIAPKTSGVVRGLGTPVFEAEPKYDRQSLSMLEIGPKATSTGERNSHVLTYLNSPSVDPALVFRFTGKQIARGWAGNPFFHPFIWNGFYVFDFVYDDLGRVIAAAPIREDAGSRVDPFSEPLEFVWAGDSKRLLSIKGKRSGYVRELDYGGDGRLKSERITCGKSHGSIEYEYVEKTGQLKSARSDDECYDKRQRVIIFDTAR